VREIWVDLGQTMRALRRNANLSLRQAEVLSGWGRGTMSQAETGRARPSRRLVEWYDTTLHGDGLLMALYAEARLAHDDAGPVRVRRHHAEPGDAVRVESALVPTGTLVGPGAELEVGWALANIGEVAWTGRQLRRIGAVAGPRLVTSAPVQPIPDCVAGGRTDVRLKVAVPVEPGTVVAYWEIVDEDERISFAEPPTLSVVLVVES
jgi:transcriptional regulator with XRE-family HTH domain